ncbi:MAG TPA: cytochrome P450 [Chitinophagaceae bacterium]|nr:cytochrome P450 [Chitinophagaceae bacterium]
MMARNEHISDVVKKVPIAGGLPFIGLSLKAAKDPLLLLNKLSQQYGDAVKLRLGLKDFYLLQSPAAARHVLKENARNYYKPGAAKLMKKVLGDGLATSNGDLWLQQRRVMQPAFHHQRLTHFFEILQLEISSLIKEWKKKEAHEPVNVSKAFLGLTLNNLTKAMFGTSVEGHIDDIARVLQIMLDFSSDNAKALVKIPLSIPTKSNLQFKKAEEKFEKIIHSFIELRQNERRQDPATRHNDLLEMLLTARDTSGAAMTAKQLRDEITTIFLAGHETTAQTLSWIFYHLALHPAIYQKVKGEAALIGSCQMTVDSLQHLPYIKSVIEEAMRFYPPIWIIARKAAEDDNINGYHLPAGATVLINVYGMHHNPSYWKLPEAFDPSHFCKETLGNRPPFLYLPFGGGQRVCIGQHFAMMVMQAVILRLVMEFDFSVPTNFVPAVDANLTLRAKEDIHLFIQKTKAYADNNHNSRLC